MTWETLGGKPRHCPTCQGKLTKAERYRGCCAACTRDLEWPAQVPLQYLTTPSGETPPRLVRATVRSGEVVHLGWRHHQILQRMQALGCPKPGIDDQGFLDQDGHFIRRAPASVLAFRSGQTPEFHHTLLSEHLWGPAGEPLDQSTRVGP